MPLDEFNLGKGFTTCKVQRFWATKIPIMLLLPSRCEKRFNYRLQNPWCHNYNFLNTCFNCFSYFLLQDGKKSLTAGSKIHICYNCNYFLNTCFEYFSYFLLQYGTKDITAGSKIHVCHNNYIINIYFD